MGRTNKLAATYMATFGGIDSTRCAQLIRTVLHIVHMRRTCMLADVEVEARAAYQVIDRLGMGFRDSIDAEETGVMVVGVEGHVGVGQVVGGHALRQHAAHVSTCAPTHKE